MSWGVFSALFVVQASVGGTVSSALERVAGAVLGAVVGVGAVLLPVDRLTGTLRSLLIGVSIMSLLAARWREDYSSISLYKRLLGDAIESDNSLFTRSDNIEAAWRIVEDILDHHDAPISTYEPGSWGPEIVMTY